MSLDGAVVLAAVAEKVGFNVDCWQRQSQPLISRDDDIGRFLVFTENNQLH